VEWLFDAGIRSESKFAARVLSLSTLVHLVAVFRADDSGTVDSLSNHSPDGPAGDLLRLEERLGASQRADLMERLALDTYEANKQYALQLLCAPQLHLWTLVLQLWCLVKIIVVI
jgi:hypothetical protein